MNRLIRTALHFSFKVFVTFSANIRIIICNQNNDTMEKIKIGLVCSPSRIMSHQKFSVTKVLITYGGGMGGVTETFHCTDVLERVTDADVSFTRLQLVSGEVIEINPRFIVKKSIVNVVKMVSDTTAHANYYAKKYKQYIQTHIFELSFGEDYEIVESADTKLHVIYSNAEITPL